MKLQPQNAPSRKLFKQYGGNTYDLDEWHDIFLASDDPTEYKAALELVGTWAKWKYFKASWPGFNKILEEWKIELDIKLRSEAVRAMCTHSKSDKGMAAAKWLAEGRYSPTVAGRPSKAKVQREIKIQAGIHEEVNDDIERVMESIDMSREN